MGSGSGSGSDQGSGGPTVNACPGTSSGAKLVVPTYPADSAIVAVKNLADYAGVDPTGTTDMTAIFNMALADVVTAGGGTLWVPAGTYRFDQALVMPPSVTLRGDWKAPTATDKSVGGTIFAIHYTGGPFMQFTSDASVNGVSFWYPDQTIGPQPVGTATAIAFMANGSRTVQSVTVRNVTFVNPTIAIDTHTFAPDDTGGSHMIWNVYGAALDTFEILRATSSGAHNEENHLAARYWSESGLPGAPAYADLAAYMQAHAIGAVYLDNWATTNMTIEDFATGISFQGKNIDDVVTGQQTVGLEVSGAHHALEIATGNTFYINNAALSATVGADASAVYIAATVGKASLILNEVTLASNGIAIDNEAKDFAIDVSQTTFAAWTGYAIKSLGGDLVVAGSQFQQTGNKDFSLTQKTEQALIMSSTFADSLKIDGNIPAAQIWKDKANDALVLAGGIQGFAASGLATQLQLPPQPQPSHSELFDAACFGAVPDCTTASFEGGVMTGGCTDNTVALQAALDAAGASGGGVVYIPASTTTGGYYIGGHLSIPDGVELLGADGDRQFRLQYTHTVLIVEGDAAPFATLGAHAGVRGLAFWYANQDGYHPQPFGYTIQAHGTADWAVNVDLPNASYGLDFGTYGSDGHYINSLSSQSYINPVYISRSSSGFMLDYGGSGGGGNSSKNANVAYPSSPINPPGDMDMDGYTDTDVGQAADCYAYGTGILLGSAKQEVILNAYVHSPHTGLATQSDDGSGPSFTLIHFGSESFTGVNIQALESAKIVLSEYHTIAIDGYPENNGTPIDGQPYLIVGDHVDPSAPITMFTLANHSYTPIGFDLRGGHTVIQSYYSDLDDGKDGNPVTAAVDIRKPNTGFAVIGGKFLNPIDNGFVVDNEDASPNVAFAGMRMQTTLRTSGAVDLSFQPTWGGGAPPN